MNTANPRPRTVSWLRIKDNNSFEHMSLARHAYGYQLRGVVLATQAEKPLRVEYRIACDDKWRTKVCVVDRMLGSERKTLTLSRDGGSWFVDGRHEAALNGCDDVDLGISPSTNTLAINRLDLGRGDRREIRAAWVKFPEMTVAAAVQSYERLSASQYLYRGLGTGFKATLDVDSDGLVELYEGIWQRVGASEGDCVSIVPWGSFAGALVAERSSSDLGTHAADLDWLVGCWSATVRDFDKDGAVREGTGEWWFNWVLEGRALQDVWIAPARHLRSPATNRQVVNNRYGTTVRTFTVKDDRWRIVWINPVFGAWNELSGQRTGNRIVLEGRMDGEPIRWSFNDISPTRFVWRGETQRPDGTWMTGSEFFLTKQF